MIELLFTVKLENMLCLMRFYFDSKNVCIQNLEREFVIYLVCVSSLNMMFSFFEPCTQGISYIDGTSSSSFYLDRLASGQTY
jgi:hypothetical protein